MKQMLMLEGYYNSNLNHGNHMQEGKVYEFSDEHADWLVENHKATPYVPFVPEPDLPVGQGRSARG